MINYQRLSVDLGMHLQSFDYLQKNHSRQQDIQRLRDLYSAVENRKRTFKLNDILGSEKIINKKTESQSSLTPERVANYIDKILDEKFLKSSQAVGLQETSKDEVREILNQKMKNFRELVKLHQKKSQIGFAHIPIQEFKTILKTLGINLPFNVWIST